MSAAPAERSREEIRDHAAATLRWLEAEAQDAVSRAGDAYQAEHPDHR
jgi:hypothetical protein